MCYSSNDVYISVPFAEECVIFFTFAYESWLHLPMDLIFKLLLSPLVELWSEMEMKISFRRFSAKTD